MNAMRQAVHSARQSAATWRMLLRRVIVPCLVGAALLLWLLLVLSVPTLAHAGEEFLDPEAAFHFSAQALDDRRVELRIDIAPDYHLYADRLTLDTDPAGRLPAALPDTAGERMFDVGLQKEVRVYRRAFSMVLPWPEAPARAFTLRVGYQGCADQGLCYPPVQRTLALGPGASAGAPLSVRLLTDDEAAAWAAPAADAGAGPAAADDTGRFVSALASRQLLVVCGVFLLAGLLLSFTPCVLPMIPILSSIIIGQGSPVSRGKGFRLALAYSLGMALVYTAMGVAAGLMGEGLAASLQNGWVLGGFALLLGLLSLSMFGVYELQMPSAVQSRLAGLSGRLQGGRYLAVFVMGGLSALIVGPCVAAPLAGALVYISRTQDAALGGVALFSLASGMSVPLLMMGASAQALLPRAGRWMNRVKPVFGVMLLAVAAWMVSPWWLPALDLRAVDEEAPAFESIDSLPGLEAAVRQSARPVLVDFYADWCTACKELEALTLHDPGVRQRLAGFRLLRVDISANTAQHQALLRRFSLFGPPALLFFAPAGAELAAHRVIGFQDAPGLLGHLDQIRSTAHIER